MKIAVVGVGYVGLITAVCLAELGNNVVCLDVDAEKIDMLKSGILPITEDGLDTYFEKNRDHLSFTSDCSFAYNDAEIIFITVGTPEKKDGSVNLKYVLDAAEGIAKNIGRDCLVVIKSTVPVGTNDRIESLINKNMRSGINVEVASNPEFLAQGSAIHDVFNASRIVIGAESESAVNTLKKLYAKLNQPFVITGRRSAEMIKFACNDFLALKISYINEIANLCEIMDADIDDVIKGMQYDPRIGNRYLSPGIGYGGSCFPKDTKALHWLAGYRDYELKTVKATIEVNESQKLKLLKKASRYYESLEGLNIAVLGLTFKPGTDDLRDAPSLHIVPMLLDEGAVVSVWDPLGMERFSNLIPGVTSAKSIEDALNDADLCFILTEWKEIAELDINAYRRLMKKPIVLDGRNCYDPARFLGTGITYDSIGRHVTV